MEHDQKILELEERITELESKVKRPASRKYLMTLIWVFVGVFLLLMAIGIIQFVSA
ncbi:hypothetical protein D3C75_241720 [compost metagenome]